MKKILLSTAILATAGAAFGQVNVSTTPSNRVALLEEYTGNFCTYCPDGHLIATEDVEPTGAVTIKIQTGGFSGTDPVFGGNLQTTAGNAIADPFDSNGYPNGTVSRAGAGYNGIGRGDWLARVNTIQSQASEVNLYVEADLDVTTRELTVSVEYYYTGTPSSATNYLHIGYYQDNIPAYQYDPGFNPGQFYLIEEGIYDFDHCFRDMVNGTWGEAVAGLSAGSTGIITRTVTLPASFSTFDVEPGAIKVYAFMSEAAQGEVITVKKSTPNYTNWPSTDEAGIIYALGLNDENCLGVNSSFAPKILVGAYGENGLNTLDVDYGVNGAISTENLTALNLDPSEKKAITLPTINFTYAASNDLDVEILNPNGMTDPTMSDNSFSTAFNGGNTGTAAKIRIEVKGDQYMTQESSFVVKNGAGTTILNVPKAQMLNSGTKTWDLSLPAGTDCYTFELADEYGDGWGVGTTSHFKVFDYTGNVLGAQIKLIDSDATLTSELVGATEITSSGASASIEEIGISAVSIYPNPASDKLNVAFNGVEGNYTVSILDLSGRLIVSQSNDVNGATELTFSVSEIASGSYILSIASERGTQVENIVIK
jgi:hypothetical protein